MYLYTLINGPPPQNLVWTSKLMMHTRIKRVSEYVMKLFWGEKRPGQAFQLVQKWLERAGKERLGVLLCLGGGAGIGLFQEVAHTTFANITLARS